MRNLQDKTLFEWLALNEKKQPQAIALATTEYTITYKELMDDVCRLCSGLAKLGVGKGDVVAGQLANNRMFVTVLLAVAARGGVFQTLHMAYRSNELRMLLEDSKAKVVFSTADPNEAGRVGEVLALKQTLPMLETVVAVGGIVPGAISYREIASTDVVSGDIVQTTPDDLYLMLYTSGTTARPKGVPHSCRSFLNNALSSAMELEFDSNSRILSLAPMTHLYGLFTLHLSLAVGATALLIPVFNPKTLLDDIAILKPTAIFAAPAHFSSLVSGGRLLRENFSGVKILCLSGATVPPPLAQTLDDLLDDGVVIQLWGMSELQAGSFGRPSDPVMKRVTTAGRATPQSQLRTVSLTGEVLPAGTEGELEVKGPSVFKGYWHNDQETNKAFTSDGWFRTGDLAIVDDEGYVTLTGRTKELINRGGVKYNPVEVELVISQLDSVALCVVVALSDPALGERGCICIQTVSGKSITLEEVTTALSNAGLAKYKWPERLVVLDSLPMTPTGKVMRSRLAESIKSISD